jgi:hypothetical protein
MHRLIIVMHHHHIILMPTKLSLEQLQASGVPILLLTILLIIQRRLKHLLVIASFNREIIEWELECESGSSG